MARITSPIAPGKETKKEDEQEHESRRRKKSFQSEEPKEKPAEENGFSNRHVFTTFIPPLTLPHTAFVPASREIFLVTNATNVDFALSHSQSRTEFITTRNPSRGFLLSGLPELEYEFETSLDLINWWIIGRIEMPPSGSYLWSDPVPSYSHRFFRLKLRQPILIQPMK